MSDLLRHPAWLFKMVVLGEPATDPAIDLTDLDAGRPLEVAAQLREGRRSRLGGLTLDTTASHVLVWRAHDRFGRPRRRSEPHPLGPPIAVDGVEDHDWPFRKLHLSAGGNRWVFLIPAVDVPLVRAAIGLANTRPPATRPGADRGP